MKADDGLSSKPAEPVRLTRADLYALVWAEPMLKVAARFGVSSSYMARICTLMNVPRPERGHWAKVAVGKTPLKPELPEARPHDQIMWNRSGEPEVVRRALPRPPAIKPKRRSEIIKAQPELHPLIHGAKMHFEAGRTSYDSEYLRPWKRLLVDLIVSRPAIDKALSFANRLFRELEAHSCHVVIAAGGQSMRRAAVDEHELPRKRIERYDDSSRLWSPRRFTVTYVGTVAIGLTVVELSEEAEARYVNGSYVRLDAERTQSRRGRYSEHSGWTTKRDFPTGRLCLQAYCPDRRGDWTRQWRESGNGDLSSRIPSIIRELLDAAPVIARLIEEGEQKAVLERQRWEEQRREHERIRAEERAAKARHDSQQELLRIISVWTQSKRIQEFLADAGSRLCTLEPELRRELQERLELARQLVGPDDALERLREWSAPEERLTE